MTSLPQLSNRAKRRPSIFWRTAASSFAAGSNRYNGRDSSPIASLRGHVVRGVGLAAFYGSRTSS